MVLAVLTETENKEVHQSLKKMNKQGERPRRRKVEGLVASMK